MRFCECRHVLHGQSGGHPAPVGMTDDGTAESRALSNPVLSNPVMYEPVVPTLPKTGEGWGTLACGASVEVKGVGQECPTHTRVSDTHKSVRPTQACPIPATLDFYLSSGDGVEVLGSPK
jgi:hypothetical protein